MASTEEQCKQWVSALQIMIDREKQIKSGEGSTTKELNGTNEQHVTKASREISSNRKNADSVHYRSAPLSTAKGSADRTLSPREEAKLRARGMILYQGKEPTSEFKFTVSEVDQHDADLKFARTKIGEENNLRRTAVLAKLSDPSDSNKQREQNSQKMLHDQITGKIESADISGTERTSEECVKNVNRKPKPNIQLLVSPTHHPMQQHLAESIKNDAASKQDAPSTKTAVQAAAHLTVDTQATIGAVCSPTGLASPAQLSVTMNRDLAGVSLEVL